MSEVKLQLLGDEDGWHTIVFSIGKLMLRTENVRWIGDASRHEIGASIAEALNSLIKHYKIDTSVSILEALEDEFNLNLENIKQNII